MASWPEPILPLTLYIHVNSALIRDESDSQGGTLTDRVEELLGGETWYLGRGCGTVP